MVKDSFVKKKERKIIFNIFIAFSINLPEKSAEN